MNLKKKSVDELFATYLKESYAEEDAERENISDYINKMVKIEQDRIIKEITNTPASANYRIKKIRDFWDETYQVYGPDVLEKLRPQSISPFQALDYQKYNSFLRNVRIMIQFDGLVKQLLHDIADQDNGGIDENAIIREIDSQLSLDSIPIVEEKTNSKRKIKNEEEEDGDGDEEEEEDIEEDSKIEDKVESIGVNDFIKMKTNLLEEINQAKISKNNNNNTFRQTSNSGKNNLHIESKGLSASSNYHNRMNSNETDRNDGTNSNIGSMQSLNKPELKYISKKKKIERFIKKPTNIETLNEAKTNPEENKPIEKISNEYIFQKEDSRSINTEQDFYDVKRFNKNKHGVHGGDMNDDDDERPNTLNVVMEQFERDKVNERLKYNNAINNHMNDDTNNNDEQTYANLVMKSSGNLHDKHSVRSSSQDMQQNPLEKIWIQKNIGKYTDFQENPNLMMINANDDDNFYDDLGNDIKNIDDNVLQRLKKRFNQAYVDKFIIDTEYEKPESNKNHIQSQDTNSNLLNDFQYINTESQEGNLASESKLLKGLLSPVKAQTNRLINGISPSLNSPSTELKEKLRRIKEKRGTSDSNNRRDSKQLQQDSQQSAKKKVIDKLQINLYAEFEEEMLMQKFMGSRSNNNNNQKPRRSTTKNLTINKSNLSKTNPEFIDNIEDFILEINRTVTSTNGIIPKKFQVKITDILKEKPKKTAYNNEILNANNNNDDQNDNNITNSKTKLKRRNSSSINRNKSINKFKYQQIEGESALEVEEEQKEESNPSKESNEYIKDYFNILINNWTFKHIDPTWEKLSAYLNQPGKVIIQLKNITNYLSNHEIDQNLLEDFLRYNAELDNLIASDESLVEDDYDKQLVKLVYFLAKYIMALKEQNEIKTKANEQKLKLNHKMNKKYLEIAELRRIEKDNNNYDQQQEEMMGINFPEWEKNLKAFHDENKLLKQIQKEKELENKREEKLEKLKRDKIQIQSELLQSLENQILESYQRIKKKKQEKEIKHTVLTSKIEYQKALKSREKHFERANIEDEIHKNLRDSEFNNKKKQKIKEEEKQERNESLKNFTAFRNMKQYQKEKELHKQTEEKIWQKAQGLIEKQRLLLKERELLDKNLKIMK